MVLRGGGSMPVPGARITMLRGAGGTGRSIRTGPCRFLSLPLFFSHRHTFVRAAVSQGARCYEGFFLD
ncbi:hypothetical protein Defa_23640 [Desulfovibrio sp. TH_2024_36128]|uniref:Uncharacterized protein n=1 Tax=Desulfovibrio falkowii TaxID=3136602 RepID=A0ABQ0EB49_9BACT